MFDQDAVSTVKILQLASAAGINICTIDSSVYGDCPGITQPSYVISALNAALAQGHVITIPKDPITVSLWSGTGYIDMDPTTGAGGYIISGGISGAVQTASGGATVESWEDDLGCEPNPGGTITILEPPDPAVYCADNTHIPIKIRYQYTCKDDGSTQDLTATHQTSSTTAQLGGGEYELRVEAFGTTASRTITILQTEIEEIAAKPDSNLALNNTYIAQPGVVETMSGWKSRYKGKSSSSGVSGITYEWQRRTHAGSGWVGFGSTSLAMEHTESNEGDFDVRLAAQLGTKTCGCTERRVKVVSPLLDNFALVQGGEYKKVGNSMVFPTTGITMQGKISKTGASPTTTNIKWGYIQGISSPRGNYRMCEWIIDPLTWTWLPAGTGSNAVYPKKIVADRTMTSIVNDAPAGHYLYGLSTAKSLGSTASEIDTPGVTNNILGPTTFNNSAGTPTAQGSHKLDASAYKYIHNFTVWIVAFNEATNQYKPLKQQSWKLHIDGSTGTSWFCTPLGIPANPSTTLTDGSATTSDSTKAISTINITTINHPNVPSP